MTQQTPPVGTIGWLDLTVEEAPAVRDFYRSVVGWQVDGCPMGDYEDFVMSSPNGDGVAGVCHARGGNAGLPAVWIPYFVVEDLDKSLNDAQSRGGSIIAGPKSMGSSRYCVIRDPAGAVSALYQP